jgi:superfamily II DNA or RNA helicase
MTDPRSPPDWRERLGDSATGSNRAGRASLGVLVELRELLRTGNKWNAPTARRATTLRAGAQYRLAVRPVLRSATGNWVRGDVTWSSIGFQSQRLALDARQVRWFSQFAALHRAATDGYRAHEPDWLYLDDFASPLLWPLLGEGATSGIAFVTGKRDERVRLAAAPEVAVDISEDADGLRLTPRVLLDGAPLKPTGLIGDHGLYSCAFEGTALSVVLAPVPEAALDAVGWTLPPGSRAFTTIPFEEADEFWRDYFPVLARRLPVESRDIELPEVREQNVLIVEFGARDTVRLRWELWLGTRHEPLDRPPVDLPERLTGVDAAEFVHARLPELEADGIRVVLVGERPPYREHTETPALRLTAVESEKRDWLELGFLVTVGNVQVPFAKLFRALSQGRKKLLLPDKSYLSLDQPVFDALRELIEEGVELDEWQTGARVSRYSAALLEPFEDLADVLPEAVAWREAASALRTPPEPIAAPDGLVAELRPYQLEGYRWLAHLWHHRLGGVLADDMGLGKTLQIIALMVHAQAGVPAAGSPAAAASRAAQGRRPWLVVAPTSVVGNWASELARFAPGLRVATVADTRRPLPTEADVVLTSYAVFRLRFPDFDRARFAALVLDEAQFVKNPASRIHECALELDVPVTYAVTGTPLENSLLDLWALLRIVAPGLFASKVRFSERFIKVQKRERIEELRRRIRPLLLRRTKALVAVDLPPKQEQVLALDLEPEHRALYDRYLQRERQKLLNLVEDLDRNRFIVFRSLTLLRLLALDATLVDPAYSGTPSSKLEALMEQLDDVVVEGHRALVFSQFTSYLTIVRARLEAQGIEYVYLDGSTLRREEVIARFRTGEAPVFLISLKAGGFGLTLTEADYVFLLDPWWNPATETQAIDRAHRIGQTSPVMVYRLVARDTIEEKVLALGEAKRRLFDEVVDDGAVFSSALNADDIRGLLG